MLVVLQTTVFPHLRVFGADARPAAPGHDRRGLRGAGPRPARSSGSSAASPSTASCRRRSACRRWPSRSSATWWASSRAGCCGRRAGWPRSWAGSADWSGGRCSSWWPRSRARTACSTATALKIIVVSALYDALLAPLIFPIGRWACRRLATPCPVGRMGRSALAIGRPDQSWIGGPWARPGAAVMTDPLTLPEPRDRGQQPASASAWSA